MGEIEDALDIIRGEYPDLAEDIEKLLGTIDHTGRALGKLQAGLPPMPEMTSEQVQQMKDLITK